MKKVTILAMVGAMMMSLNGYSQGNVQFSNNSATAIINSLTTLPADAGLLRVGLYYAAPGTPDNLMAPTDDYTLVPPTALTISGGRFLGPTKIIPDIPAGSPADLQIRAWSAAFATYEEAYNAGLAGNSSVLVGGSPVMRSVVLGGGTVPTPSLINSGLQSFEVKPVPEPSMIALSLLGGLGAMVLLRRRRM